MPKSQTYDIAIIGGGINGDWVDRGWNGRTIAPHAPPRETVSLKKFDRRSRIAPVKGPKRGLKCPD